jgi:endonuclease/exonuclease/phosphatase (EEP) superfamily protein YafD
LQVIVVHPQRPGRPWRTGARNSHFDKLAEREWSGATVLPGDLNATGYSPGFNDLLRRSGLSDCWQGFGRRPSRGPQQASLRHVIALDHVLVQDVEVLERRTDPDRGGHHLPVTAVPGLPPN